MRLKAFLLFAKPADLTALLARTHDQMRCRLTLHVLQRYCKKNCDYPNLLDSLDVDDIAVNTAEDSRINDLPEFHEN